MPSDATGPFTAEATCQAGPFESTASHVTFTREGKVIQTAPTAAAQP